MAKSSEVDRTCEQCYTVQPRLKDLNSIGICRECVKDRKMLREFSGWINYG